MKQKSRDCCLCRQEAKLIHSHIFPEFFYSSLYEEPHHFEMMSNNPQRQRRTYQKGVREYLLCKKCEEQFNKYETYAAKLLNAVPQEVEPQMEVLYRSPFDYRQFKLFCLSLMWRAHISSKDFSNVRLGTHAEIMRKMLLAEDAGEANQYGFGLFRICGNPYVSRTMTSPVKTKWGNLPAYLFTALGFRWICVLSNPFLVDPILHSFFIGLAKSLTMPVYWQTEEEFMAEQGNAIRGKKALMKAIKERHSRTCSTT